MIHQTVQSIVSTFAKLDPFLADGSQRRGSICADREIIKPDDADLVRNFVSELLTLNHRGIGDQIMVAQCGSSNTIFRTSKTYEYTGGQLVEVTDQDTDVENGRQAFVEQKEEKKK